MNNPDILFLPIVLFHASGISFESFVSSSQPSGYLLSMEYWDLSTKSIHDEHSSIETTVTSYPADFISASISLIGRPPFFIAKYVP